MHQGFGIWFVAATSASEGVLDFCQIHGLDVTCVSLRAVGRSDLGRGLYVYVHWWYTVITGQHYSLSSSIHPPAVLTRRQYSPTSSIH